MKEPKIISYKRTLRVRYDESDSLDTRLRFQLMFHNLDAIKSAVIGQIERLKGLSDNSAKAKAEQIEEALDRLNSACYIKVEINEYYQCKEPGALTLDQIEKADFSTVDSMLDLRVESWDGTSSNGRFILNRSLRQALNLARKNLLNGSSWDEPLWGKTKALLEVEKGIARQQDDEISRTRRGYTDWVRIHIRLRNKKIGEFTWPNPAFFVTEKDDFGVERSRFVERSPTIKPIFAKEWYIHIENEWKGNELVTHELIVTDFSEKALKKYGTELLRKDLERGYQYPSERSSLFEILDTSNLFSAGLTPPMDGTLTKEHWFFESDYQYKYHPGPGDCAWIEEKNKLFDEWSKKRIRALILKEAEIGVLCESENNELKRLSEIYPDIAESARAEYAPARKEREVKEAREAARRREVEAVENAKRRERERVAREAEAKRNEEARISTLNHKLHAFFRPDNFVRQTSELNDILSAGAQVNAIEEGYTPLMRAVDLQDDRMAEHLLEIGADPLLRNSKNKRASDMAGTFSPIYITLKTYELMTAVQRDDLALVKSVFLGSHHNMGIPNFINAQFGERNDTAIIIAAKKNNKGVVDVLLSEGADPSITNKAGQSACTLTSSQDIRDLLEEYMQEGLQQSYMPA